MEKKVLGGLFDPESKKLDEVISMNTIKIDNKQAVIIAHRGLSGIEKENTAAIGDYFNDYEMLRQVGLPACCGQAPKGMKDIAKLVTCHCNDGAVADLIEYIIQNG